MFPFGQTLYLWRAQNRLTQKELARQSGISRPNLSAIENGARDITLTTLRRLARALHIRPGILADGIPPVSWVRQRLSREKLDRIAHALAGKSAARGAQEKAIVHILGPLVRRKLGLSKKPALSLPRTARREYVALLRAKAGLEAGELKSILNRAEKILSVS